MEAGGMDTTGRPVSAKNYGPFLDKKGFAKVPAENYVPQKGDVVVIQPYKGGSEHGHIAMYDGQQWVSDFKQKDMWGGSGYRNNKPPHQIYRP
jgi:type VI secretion system secreted protein VgrG